MRILVGNEPRSYREVIAAALHELRLHVEVIIGRYRGKRGKVLRVFPKDGRIIVDDRSCRRCGPDIRAISRIQRYIDGFIAFGEMIGIKVR